MAATLTLKIITPERVLLEKQVDQVVARGTAGEFQVLPGHEPLVSALGIDILRYSQGDTEDAAAIMGGILEVKNDEVTVLSDAAELDMEIDEARARQAKEKAEAEKTMKTDKMDVYVTELALSRALARLKASELRQRRRQLKH